MDDSTSSPNPGAAATPASTGAPRLWRNEGLAAAADRRRAIAVLAGLTLVAGWGLFSVFGWFRPLARPSMIVLGDPSGRSPAGSPASQWEGDRRALADLAGFRPIAGRTSAGTAVPLVEGPGLLRADDQAGTLVVYLHGPAWIDVSNPADEEPGVRFAGSGSGLAPDGPMLEEVLGAIRAHPAAHKLLILDVQPPPGDPRLGVVLDDVASAVDELAKSAVKSDPRLAILVAAEPGQRPTALEALGRSSFGYYAEQGLRGAAEASGDGRVSVRELAAFVRDRVARAGRLGLDARQTPRLHQAPEADDFPLVLADRRMPGPAALPKAAPAYPAWLLEGWRERDAARKAGLDRDAPRIFGQVEAALLDAERDWRGGFDEARVRSELADLLARLRGRIGPSRAIPHPRPRSLALEATLGGLTPDPELAKAVQQAVAARARPTAESKPGEVEAANARAIAEFLGKLKPSTDFGLAWAAFEAAAADPAPGRDAIAFLDQMLRVRQPRPLYAETDALRRLARLPARGWQPETARLMLELTRRGEAAQDRPSALFGTADALNSADRLRHEAEALVAWPGYATPGEADRLLRLSLVAADAARGRSSTVDEARRLLDEAAGVLPVATPLLGLDDLDRAWGSAADAARAVADRLSEDRAGGEARPLDGLEREAVELREALAPFGPTAIAARVERLTRPGPIAGPIALREIGDLLATPLPSADQRPALWKAATDLERARAGEALRLDERDRRTARPPSLDDKPGGDPIERLAAGSMKRLERSERLLALAGLGDEAGSPELGPIAEARSHAERWAGVERLATSEDQPVARRDRASRLVSPRAASPRLDDPATNPTRGLRSGEFDALRKWLAARHAFEAIDPEPSEFHADAARDMADRGTRPPESIRLDHEPSLASLDPGHPEAIVRVRLRLDEAAADAGRAGPSQVEISLPNEDGLDLRTGSPWPTARGGDPSATRPPLRFPIAVAPEPVDIPLVVALRPEPEGSKLPLPEGLLVRARWKGRTYHHRIPLRIEPESRRLRAYMSEAASPASPIAGVRLRAAQGKRPFALHLENPGDRDRRVRVELLDRRGPVAGASASPTVKAGESARVSFGPPLADPETGFAEVAGPLTIRITDLDEPGEPIERTVPVGLASPDDIVRVVSGHYDPPGGEGGERSRLEFRIRAIGPIVGPPCPVELSLPAERIPDLLSAGEGTFKGTLEKLGDELVLFAEGVRLDPHAGESGLVHLSVDGVERALVYRVRFAAEGESTIPVRDRSTAVRLRVGRSSPPTAPLKVDADLDSSPEGGQLELTLGRYVPGEPRPRFQADSELTTESGRGRIRLNPRGPDGSLVFEAAVRGASHTLEVGRIRGRRVVRARLLDERGVEKAKDEVEVILDDRPPADVAFEAAPKYAIRGSSLKLRATGKVPDSGIKEVVFFVGRPAEGKRPAGAAPVPGRLVPGSRATWAADLPLGDAKLGPLDVSVEFVAGVGASRFDTAVVSVVELIPIAPGIIRGLVREGERPQPGLEVQVLDEKGASKAKAKTDDAGKFEVAGLPPGDYVVVSGKLTPPTRGTAPASIKPGATAEVEVPLFRVR